MACMSSNISAPYIEQKQNDHAHDDHIWLPLECTPFVCRSPIAYQNMAHVVVGMLKIIAI